MPGLVKSRVGSFAGTSGLEGTTVCPFERKYSRKLERISFDFIGRILLEGARLAGRERVDRQRGVRAKAGREDRAVDDPEVGLRPTPVPIELMAGVCGKKGIPGGRPGRHRARLPGMQRGTLKR